MAQAARPAFQFSIREMLVVLFLISIILTFRHVGVGHFTTWEEDATFIAIALLSALGGAWFSQRIGYTEHARVVFGLLGFSFSVIVMGVLAGQTTYTCFRCCASRHDYFGVFSTVDEGQASRRIEAACGAPCPHAQWQLRGSSSPFIHAYGGPPRMPIRMPTFVIGNSDDYFVISLIERLPKMEWRRQVFDALGDETNRLKYVGLWVIVSLSESSPQSDEAWDDWWRLNSNVFVREPDSGRARPIAKAALFRYRPRIAGPIINYIFEDVSINQP